MIRGWLVHTRKSLLEALGLEQTCEDPDDDIQKLQQLVTALIDRLIIRWNLSQEVLKARNLELESCMAQNAQELQQIKQLHLQQLQQADDLLIEMEIKLFLAYSSPTYTGKQVPATPMSMPCKIIKKSIEEPWPWQEDITLQARHGTIIKCGSKRFLPNSRVQ